MVATAPQAIRSAAAKLNPRKIGNCFEALDLGEGLRGEA